MKSVAFGFLDEATCLAWAGDRNRIEPRPDHEAIVARLRTQASIHKGWIYPPLGPLDATADAPRVPRFFTLSATHDIVLTAADATDEEADFLVLLFGMLKGRRLQREGWIHFYKTPLDRQLNDFLAKDSEITATLAIATSFWRQHPDTTVRKLMFGALHWHLFAQLYEHEFERFNAQYTALDTCAELARRIAFPGYPVKRPPHALRAAALCDCTGVRKPTWVAPPAEKTGCELSARRNALIHDALWGSEPIGFAAPADQGAMTLALTALVARVFLRLLGVRNSYITSSCETCQTMPFGAPE